MRQREASQFALELQVLSHPNRDVSCSVRLEEMGRVFHASERSELSQEGPQRVAFAPPAKLRFDGSPLKKKVNTETTPITP